MLAEARERLRAREAGRALGSGTGDARTRFAELRSGLRQRVVAAAAVATERVSPRFDEARAHGHRMGVGIATASGTRHAPGGMATARVRLGTDRRGSAAGRDRRRAGRPAVAPGRIEETAEHAVATAISTHRGIEDG